MMSDNDIQIILRRLEVMDQNRQHDVERLHEKLDTLSLHGCAKASVHASIDRDHEDRLRGLEQYKYKQIGQVGMVGGLAGLGTAVLVLVGKFFLFKLGGSQ